MPELRIFVYGTLKRGCKNHDRYCRGYRSAEPATVLGRLYHLPPGYPTLVVPESHVLALGTNDPVADVAAQEQLSHEPATETETLGIHDWQSINGEILSFDDPLTRLPALDELEEFHPGRPSLYLRVLLRTEGKTGQVVWTYIAPGGQPPQGAKRIGTSWP